MGVQGAEGPKGSEARDSPWVGSDHTARRAAAKYHGDGTARGSGVGTRCVYTKGYPKGARRIREESGTGKGANRGIREFYNYRITVASSMRNGYRIVST